MLKEEAGKGVNTCLALVLKRIGNIFRSFQLSELKYCLRKIKSLGN